MNRNAYNKIVEKFSAVRTQFHGREAEYLALLLEDLPQGATVLDLGCGTGIPMAQAVIAAGYTVVGVDQAEKLLDLAKATFPTQVWLLASMESYGFDHQYHGVIIWDSLFHLERSSHEPILRQAIAGLPMGGRLMLTIGGSEHPAFTDVMFGETFFYDSHAPETMAAILTGLDCRILVDEFMNKPTTGRNKGRCVFVVEKVAEVTED
jgi:2-polyprenyl-3-methyl-5-hydroxy-6-metoxy-1,4-benzoquinol methylase